MADSPRAPRLDDDNPWPGLDAYTEDAQPYFHGREDDSAQLLRLIRMSTFVALYGKSGLGKSSMLQAGVFPQLRKLRFLPVHLRLDYTEAAEQPPLRQALARLGDEITRSGSELSASAPAAGESLWAYLQRRERPIWTRDNFPVTPVLVFDQFEEVFSRGGSPEHIKHMLEDIADLVGDRPSSELADDRDAARQLNLQSQQYRVVLSFRSDFLADVLSWSAAAGLPRHESLHLKAMTREAAIEAVEKAGAAVIEPGMAPRIVDFVLDRDAASAQTRANEVEPVLLSLCCYQLNSRRQRPARIDAELLKSVGQDILLGFYREALAGTEPRVAVFIEDNLIQGGRFRSSFPREAALASGALTEAELDLLQARRLLRLDLQDGVLRIELIHDRLVGLVRDAREARLAREKERRERAASERRDQAERERTRAAEVAQSRNRLRLLLGLLGAVSLVLVYTGIQASLQRDAAEASASQARSNARHAEALRLGVEAQGMLNGTVAGGDWRAYQELLAARGLWAGPETSSALFGALVARRHLRALVPVEVKTESPVFALAFAPLAPGRPVLLAAGHADGSITLLDPEHPQAGGPRQVGHTDVVRSLAISPDGMHMVSAGEDGRLRRWRLHPFEPDGPPLLGQQGAINSVGFSPDGTRFVSGGQDGWVRLWDSQDGAPLRASDKPVPNTPVFAVAFNPAPLSPAIYAVGAVPAVSTGPGPGRYASLLVYNASTLDLEGIPQYAHSQDALALAVSPAGDRLATGGLDGSVRVRSLAADRQRGGPSGGLLRLDSGGDVQSVAFSPNGHWLAAGTEHGELRLWSVGGDPLGPPLAGRDRPVNSVAFSPDGRWLAAASDDGVLRLWPTDPGWATQAGNAGPPPDSRSLAIGPDGRSTLFGLEDGSLLLRRAGAGDVALHAPLQGPRGAGPAARPLLACDPARLAQTRGYSGQRGGQDTASSTRQHAVLALAIAADGLHAASAHADGSLQRWDLGSGTAVGDPLQVSDCPLEAVALSGNGQRIAVADKAGSVIWMDASGRPVRTLPATGDARQWALALDAPGLRLARAGKAGSILLYGPADGAPALIDGGIEALASLAFSPDGTVIASGSELGKVRLWQVDSRTPIGMPQSASSGPIRAVAFSADGKQVLSAGSRADVQSWPAPGNWPELMCAKLGSNLSRKAWSEWISPDIPYHCPCPGLRIEPDTPDTQGSAAAAEVCPAAP